MAVTQGFFLSDAQLWRNQCYVDGEWRGAKSGETFAVTDPATGKSIGEVPEMDVDELKEAIKCAQAAFPAWSKTLASQRQQLMLKLHASMVAAKDDLARIITLENGKPLCESAGEMAYGTSFIDWFANEAIRDCGDVIPNTNSSVRNVVVKQPIGVVGILSVWNFPVAMITRKLGAALAAGCTVVKCPPETPFSPLAIVELCERAGFPKGVVNAVTTNKNTIAMGEEFCTNKAVKKITFTGSTAVGKILMQQSASTLKKLSLELGGNAPFIVFPDADIDAAVAGAVASKFRNTGQACISSNRFFCHSSKLEDFTTKLAAAVGALKIGNGFAPDVSQGPLIHERAVEKVARHVEDAVKKGAKVLVGGKRREDLGPAFFEPTVLSDCQPCAINMEETFGPVAAVYSFETEEEVVERANDTAVGLAGYFYSRDIGRIWRVAEALEVGMVAVNVGVFSSAVIPFGGVGESGFGREGSKYGLSDYQQIKYIAMGF